MMVFLAHSASRGVWLLHYFSHTDVCILDGGFENWLKSDYPVETKTNPFIHSENVFRINNKVLADAEYIKNIIEQKTNDVFVIDCRSEMEYDGLIVGRPEEDIFLNSVNIDWVRNLENGKFKELGKLVQLYSFIPIDKEVITYCQGGYRACKYISCVEKPWLSQC